MNRMHDPTLLWLYRRLREDNLHKSPEERIGLRRYLREAGIMSPERQRIVDYREIPFTTLGFDNEYLGDVDDEDKQ